MENPGNSFEELKQGSKSAQTDTLSPEMIKSPEIELPNLIAWSHKNNNINIIDLKTKEKYANFNGVQYEYRDDLHSHTSIERWTHVKEIPNTRLLVSLNYVVRQSVDLEIYDISQSGKAKKIYSHERLCEETGIGEVAYNARRDVLAAIALNGKIAYHLYKLEYNAISSSYCMKLLQKVKWHTQNRTLPKNTIGGTDFDPNGEFAATIDNDGICLISSLGTDTESYHMQMRMNNSSWCASDLWSRCRWSPFGGDPTLFVKYDCCLLNIFDSEKRALVLKSPIDLELSDISYVEAPTTRWIDVCSREGNILAAGGTDGNIKIVDRRAAQVVNTFEQNYPYNINCVKWSKSGDLLAIASDEKAVNLLDFKTGKIIYTGASHVKESIYSVCFV